MNWPSSTYCPTSLSAASIGANPHSSFTGKERDEETGYGYFGARYMDHELMTMWLSVDPMADKYPGISPYAYCAWNPVKLVDPDGREFDLSTLTEAQQKKWKETMSFHCKNSQLFKAIFDLLDKSDTKYAILIGNTQSDGIDNDVPAQYNDNTKNLTFKNSDALFSPNAYVEEMVHAAQKNEKGIAYNKTKSFNYEFEAKLIKHLVLNEYGGSSKPQGMENYLTSIDSKYSFGETLSSSKLTLDFFQQYQAAANKYAKHNTINNIGNDNYKAATNQRPQTFLWLIKNAKP